MRYNNQAIIKEMPELKSLPLSLDQMDIMVRRADEQLLRTTLEETNYIGSKVDIYERYRTYFILDNGSIIMHPCKHAIDYASNYAYDEDYHEDGEPIAEAVARVKDPNRIKYLVIFKEFRHDVVGSPYREGKVLHVYKKPRYETYCSLVKKYNIEKNIKAAVKKLKA